jgi:hypothetical protein
MCFRLQKLPCTTWCTSWRSLWASALSFVEVFQSYLSTSLSTTSLPQSFLVTWIAARMQSLLYPIFLSCRIGAYLPLQEKSRMMIQPSVRGANVIREFAKGVNCLVR